MPLRPLTIWLNPLLKFNRMPSRKVRRGRKARKERRPGKHRDPEDQSVLDQSVLDRSGLKWVFQIGGDQPEWTSEPDIDAITTVVRKILKPKGGLAVKFLASGAFNKVYDVSFKGKSYLMRVTLPVDPFYKTMSEVATILHVQQNSSVPVPRIVAFDASRDNPIGFEWIRMEKLPGKEVEVVWHTLSWETKEELVCKTAEYVAQLLKITTTRIGSIYPPGARPGVPCDILNQQLSLPCLLDKEHKVPDQNTNWSAGRLCTRSFFWGNNINLNIPRGP